jgi:S-adenosyl methyltransferase
VPDPRHLAAFNATQPHIARVYDYLLGGKDNFAADRAVADRIIALMPAVQVGVRAQRDLLGRVVRYLVGEAGIKQLLDIGSGLPTAENVHQIAQRIEPAAKVVYVDNDPIVMSHAQAILADNKATFAAEGDLRDPAALLAEPGVRDLDWDEPIGLLLCGILHYVLDEENPAGIVEALYRELPAGSYVFIHHMLDSDDPDSAMLQAEMQKGLGRTKFRTFAEINELFAGLELVDPGVVLVPDWRPDPGTPGMADHPVLKLAAAGVARKPFAGPEASARQRPGRS